MKEGKKKQSNVLKFPPLRSVKAINKALEVELPGVKHINCRCVSAPIIKIDEKV